VAAGVRRRAACKLLTRRRGGRRSSTLVGAAGFGAAAVAGPGWFVLWFLHLHRGTFMASWWCRGVWRTIYPAGVVGGGGERSLSQVCRCAAGKACRAKVFTDTLVGGDGSDVLGRRSPVEGAIVGCFVLQHGDLG
jgi:hypothetical protein